MDTEAEIDPAQSEEAARPRSSSIKSLIAKKVRGVREVGQRLSKFNKNLSTSEQSDLNGAKLLSFNVIDDDAPRLVRTNAFKVNTTCSIIHRFINVPCCIGETIRSTTKIEFVH